MKRVALFIVVFLLVGSLSYGQIAHDADALWVLPAKTAGYVPTQKFDTVKIRILYDLGGAVPASKDGYVVRQWFVYDDPYRGDCVNCPKSPPDRWFDTEELIEKYYYGDGKFRYNSVDNTKVWQYKYARL